MASVAARKGQKLYALVNENTGIIWLASIATNTFEPWQHGEKFATRAELKAEGWALRPASLAVEDWPVAKTAKPKKGGKKDGSE
jgi:hypothetical protein